MTLTHALLCIDVETSIKECEEAADAAISRYLIDSDVRDNDEAQAALGQLVRVALIHMRMIAGDPSNITRH